MKPRTETEQDIPCQALEAAIRDGIESGVSDRTVPQIMEHVEARLRADGRLQAFTESDRRHERGNIDDSKD